jgi:hypothetical protein
MSIVPYWLLTSFAEEAGFHVEDIRFVGRLDKRGIRLIATRVLGAMLSFLRRPYLVAPTSDDGVVTMMTARKPASDGSEPRVLNVR